MNHQRLQAQREALAGKIIIGIDPAKDKHQAAVVDAHGNQRGASFSFPVSAAGYGEVLWRNIAKVMPRCNGTSPSNNVCIMEQNNFLLDIEQAVSANNAVPPDHPPSNDGRDGTSTTDFLTKL